MIVRLANNERERDTKKRRRSNTNINMHILINVPLKVGRVSTTPAHRGGVNPASVNTLSIIGLSNLYKTGAFC